MADTLSALEHKRAAIRTEFERSISDAYAGGPAGRERVWARLLPLIDAYADAKSSARQPRESTAAPANADDIAAPTAGDNTAANPTEAGTTSPAKHEDPSPILMSQTAAATQETAETEPPGPTKTPRTKPTARKATAS